MAQIFHPSMNTIAKVTIFGAIFFIAAGGWFIDEMVRSPYNTDVGVARAQPVPFSHDHHVGGLGIDCRYCHTSVEKSAFAGMPTTKTCMSCHSQIWTNAEMLEPVRASWKSGEPIRWTRVHDLPEFVQFNHSVHVAKGVGCASCHGRVDRMPLMWKSASLQMDWCLDCHRAPEKHIRPRDQVFNMAYEPPANQSAAGKELAVKYHVQKYQLTNCSICHY